MRQALAPGAGTPAWSKRADLRPPGPVAPCLQLPPQHWTVPPAADLFRGTPRRRLEVVASFVLSAPRSVVSLVTRYLGAWRGRNQVGRRLLKEPGLGAREAAPLDSTRGARSRAGSGQECGARRACSRRVRGSAGSAGEFRGPGGILGRLQLGLARPHCSQLPLLWLGQPGFIHSRPGDALRGPLRAMTEIPARDPAPASLHYADWENRGGDS